ncbi:MAG: hypothetical protein M1475_05650 [Actinobacteria bacterium]|nr:hypothetical protein [Cyanobacteriota bacterium]MCL6087877.1 hypothetical protein [Actinomycetota bacterium]
MEVIIKDHAIFEAERRGISTKFIVFAISNQQQKLHSKKGHVIVQNIYYDKTEKKEMLLRVIGFETSEKFEVITVYKTSRISKYWVKGV